MNLRRSSGRRGRLGAIGIAVGLGLVVAASAVFVVAEAVNAANSSAPGKPIPEEYRGAVIEAGTACPALSPARVAAQVMAESGFSPTATNGRGGRGLAGLTVDQWNTWKPWPTATRTDPRASLLALAHLTCDLIGHMRVDKVSGDPWELALGALYSGTDAVARAHEVPAAARTYVSAVVAYAGFYEQDSGLSLAPASPSPSAVDSPSPSVEPSASVSASPSVSHGGPTTQAAVPSSHPTTPAPPPQPLTSGALWSEEFHGCLSAVAAMDGTHLAIAACDGSMVQHWQEMPDGTIRSVGLCMDLAWAATTDGTIVQVANCSGNPAQQFTLNPQQHIYSPYANKCVNIDSQPGVGTSVVSFSCLGQPNQVFVFKKQ